MRNQDWPPELDALLAAPNHHTLILENDKVRVLNTMIKPGDKTPVHTHANPSVFYILSWSNFVRYDGEGNVMTDTRNNPDTPPEVLWSEPIGPHAVLNVGDVDLHVIGIEIKAP